MGKENLLSVKQVADYAGVSVQAIYNRLEKDFKPYLKIEKGKKRLDKEVLKLFDNAENSSDFKENFKPLLNLLEKQNEQLQRELEIKNKQIEALSTALVAAQQSVQAAQTLHAGTIQQELVENTNFVYEEKKEETKSFVKKIKTILQK